MSEAGTRANALQLQASGGGGVEVGTLRAVARGNGIPGIVVLAGAAACGVGEGRLDVLNGLITWTPPGAAAGASRALGGDGIYLLEGADPGMWLRVQVAAAFLPAMNAAAAAVVDLADVYNGLGPADVVAADALAGLVTVTEYQLVNVGAGVATSVKLWIDAAVTGLEVSSDGVTYHTPTSAVDVNVLAWASLAAGGGSVNLWVRRTIGASSVPAIAVVNALHWQWNSFT